MRLLPLYRSQALAPGPLCLPSDSQAVLLCKFLTHSQSNQLQTGKGKGEELALMQPPVGFALVSETGVSQSVVKGEEGTM